MAQPNNKADPLEEAFSSLLRAIGGVFTDAFLGMKSLSKRRSRIEILILTVAFSAAVFVLKEHIFRLFGQDIPLPVRYVVFALLLLTPLFYLAALGANQKRIARRYYKIFADIGFRQKDKQFPFLMHSSTENILTTYIFKSTIPLSEWKKAQDRLETGFNCSIQKIEEGANKRLVKLVTVPSECKIPEKIPWSDAYISQEDGEIMLGENYLQKVSFNLNRTPHVICAGETNSGKSVILRCMLWQMIKKGSRVFMIDFKGGVEFGKAYERYGEVVTDRERALQLLLMLVEENAARLKLFRELEVKNLKEYNSRHEVKLCRIGVFIDEIAEMLDKTGASKADKVIFEQIEGALSTLARLSRATGINLFLGAQRPDAKVLTGQIKNNIPVRLCGRFADSPPSEIVLNSTVACDLPDIKGRFIYKMGNEFTIFQSYLFEDEKHLKAVKPVRGGMLIDEPQFSLNSAPILPAMPEKPAAKKNSVTLNLDFGGDD
ncbi:MAG: DUF87 domain-containing protein [Oscillospiraceae bacterium]|nr:DUF87 domain-containing protein [Oscillospiraceae bacterium]MBP1557256.1 DUF87 domain-containing protein [Oscillospiraceae bacterium]MBP1577022.1 DUF87 domain-containing protein [Oscillospiraceae bacterium]